MWMISIDFFKTKNSFNVRFKKEKNHEGRENESSKQVPHSNNKPTVNRKLNQRSPEKKNIFALKLSPTQMWLSRLNIVVAFIKMEKWFFQASHSSIMLCWSE